MGIKDVIDLLRLREAPWLELVMSVLALLTVATWLSGSASLTATASATLAGLGFPEQPVADSASAVHRWFVDAQRAPWLVGPALLFTIWVAIAYLDTVRTARTALAERLRHTTALRRPRAGWGSTPEPVRPTDDAAIADGDDAARRVAEVGVEVGVQQRCVAVSWLAIALAVEVGSVWARAFAVVAILCAVLWLVTLTADQLVAVDHRPTATERLREYVGDVSAAAWRLLLQFVLSVLRLPLFALTVLTTPPAAEQRLDSTPTASMPTGSVPRAARA